MRGPTPGRFGETRSYATPRLVRAWLRMSAVSQRRGLERIGTRDNPRRSETGLKAPGFRRGNRIAPRKKRRAFPFAGKGPFLYDIWGGGGTGGAANRAAFVLFCLHSPGTVRAIGVISDAQFVPFVPCMNIIRIAFIGVVGEQPGGSPLPPRLPFEVCISPPPPRNR